MFEIVVALALAADTRPALHPRRAAQVECVAALALAGNDQARKQKGAGRFPKMGGRDQIFAGAVAQRIIAETGRTDAEVRALYKAEVERLQNGAIHAPDPKAYVDGRVKPCLPWLKAIDPKAGPDGHVKGLNDGIPASAAPATATAAAVPEPQPEHGYDPKALRCAALISLSRDEVIAREGNSKLAQSFSAMLTMLEPRAGKGADPFFPERLEEERRALAAQEARRKTQAAMGIPPNDEAEREKLFRACFDLAGAK